MDDEQDYRAHTSAGENTPRAGPELAVVQSIGTYSINKHLSHGFPQRIRGNYYNFCAVLSGKILCM